MPQPPPLLLNRTWLLPSSDLMSLIFKSDGPHATVAPHATTTTGAPHYTCVVPLLYYACATTTPIDGNRRRPQPPTDRNVASIFRSDGFDLQIRWSSRHRCYSRHNHHRCFSRHRRSSLKSKNRSSNLETKPTNPLFGVYRFDLRVYGYDCGFVDWE